MAPSDQDLLARVRDGDEAAFESLARGGTRVTGLGISGDLLYGPAQVHTLVDAARAGGVEDAAYRELSSTKGHDAFLVEWQQLAAVFAEVLEGAAVTA